MTDADKEALVRAIASQLEDSAYGIATGDARVRTAWLVADCIEPWLQQRGWMPPATYDRIHDWATRTGNIPEVHVNRPVLNSHLCELSDILHDR
jgi:hypothetical protein